MTRPAAVINAVLKLQKSTAISQPTGAALRVSLLNICATFHTRTELVYPPVLFERPVTLLKSFGDSRRPIEELLSTHGAVFLSTKNDAESSVADGLSSCHTPAPRGGRGGSRAPGGTAVSDAPMPKKRERGTAAAKPEAQQQPEEENTASKARVQAMGNATGSDRKQKIFDCWATK